MSTNKSPHDIVGVSREAKMEGSAGEGGQGICAVIEPRK